MKLTEEQIQKIDQTLNDKGLIYEDIKLEVTDHIATEIEVKMEEKGISFDEAFKQSFKNWKEQLRPSSSSWTGLKNVAPRVVIDTLVSIYKRQFILSLIFVIVFSLLMTVITALNTEEYIYNTLKLIFTSAYVLVCLSTITCLFYVWKFKSKTIYKLFFQKNCWLVGMHLYIISGLFNGQTHIFRHYSRDGFIHIFFDWFRMGFFFFMAVYALIVVNEHFKIVRKYKLFFSKL
jgi:hypothetical protein